MPSISLADQLNLGLADLIPALRILIQAELISVVFGDKHPNPHIRALQDESSNEQIAKLIPAKLEHACIYPLPKHLKSVVNKQQFCQRPYTLQLALGAPLYTYNFFDPSILIHYQQQPQCSIVNDIQGVLYLPYTNLQFSRAIYKTDSGQPLTELVATSLEHLARLRQSDQQYWHSMSFPAQCTLHPDVVLPLTLGTFRQRLSIFEALHEELMAVNALCEKMNTPYIFELDGSMRASYSIDGYLIHPTMESFYHFFIGLQILLFQNLNPAFMKTIAPLVTVHKRGKRTARLRRPSVTPLERIESWLSSLINLSAESPIRRLILLIKRTRLETTRKMARENPRLTDYSLLHLQRRLIWNTYLTVKWIRTTLEQILEQPFDALHPLVREEKIWIS